jgi:NADPH2:quinone reductase
VDLGVAPERINTTVSIQQAREVGAKSEAGADASTTQVLGEIAELVATGACDFDIAATFPIDQVPEAFDELERRHTHGKIVLLPRVRTEQTQP